MSFLAGSLATGLQCPYLLKIVIVVIDGIVNIIPSWLENHEGLLQWIKQSFHKSDKAVLLELSFWSGL